MHEEALDGGVDVVVVLLEEVARNRHRDGAEGGDVERLLVPEGLDLLHAREDERRRALRRRRGRLAVLVLARACASARCGSAVGDAIARGWR